MNIHCGLRSDFDIVCVVEWVASLLDCTTCTTVMIRPIRRKGRKLYRAMAYESGYIDIEFADCTLDCAMLESMVFLLAHEFRHLTQWAENFAGDIEGDADRHACAVMIEFSKEKRRLLRRWKKDADQADRQSRIASRCIG